MTKLKGLILNNKTYLTAIIGILTAIIAWADGQIDLTSLGAAIWGGVAIICTRIGINKASKAAGESIPADQVQQMIDQALKQAESGKLKDQR